MAGDEQQRDAERERMRAQHELMLKGIANRLEGEFGSMLTRDTLLHHVQDSYARMAESSKVLNHVPAFVERFTRQRLKALAKVRGTPEDHPPDVLFVCRRNDAASQMAAALFDARAAGGATVHSAGTEPADEPLEEAVIVMAEVGVDLSRELPEPVTPEIEEAADVVVTLDAHDDVPLVEDTRYVAWRIPDHTGEGLEGHRRLRDELVERVEALVAELVPRPPVYRATFDEELRVLEERTIELGRSVQALVDASVVAVRTLDRAWGAGADAADDDIDAAWIDLERAVVETIARRQPVAGDLRRLVAFLHAGLHLERVADGMVDVGRVLAATEHDDPPTELVAGLVAMGEGVSRMLDLALRALAGGEADHCLGVAVADAEIDRLHEDTLHGLADGLGRRAGRQWSLWADRLSRHYERAGDHVVDLAEAVWYQVTGEFREFGRQP